MEIVDVKSAVLTNYEVKNYLQQQRDELKEQKGGRREKKRKVNKSLLTVTLETLSYLDSTAARVETDENIAAFCEKLSEFCRHNVNQQGEKVSFKKSELVQMINHR